MIKQIQNMDRGVQEKKYICYVLENKWQILGFLVPVYTNIPKPEEEVVVKT